MATVVVLGGSLAGLSTAMMLAQRGHEVTVLERDAAAPATKQEGALSWVRPSIPQQRHSHVLLSRGVHVLREDLPDVFEDLLAAGSNLVKPFDFLPPAITDREPSEGIDAIECLCVRRTVQDWAVDRAAARRGIRVIRTTARGLLLDGSVVKGVSSDAGSFPADVVIEAGGRRTRTYRWLAEAGISCDEVRSPCGCNYVSRAYSLAGAPPPGPFNVGFATIAGAKGLTALLFRGDDDTFTANLQFDAEDKELMIARNPAAFTALLMALPGTAPWISAATAVTDVSVMAGLDNTSRRLVRDGTPIVTGLLQVGDSAATTNPTLGRGMSLALTGAQLVARVLDEVSDPGDRLLALDELRAEQIDPWVTEAWGIDERSITRTRHALYGEPALELPPHALPEEVAPFTFADRDAWERNARKAHMLTHPSTLYDGGDLEARVLAAREDRPPMPPPPVSREEYLALAHEAVAV